MRLQPLAYIYGGYDPDMQKDKKGMLCEKVFDIDIQRPCNQGQGLDRHVLLP